MPDKPQGYFVDERDEPDYTDLMRWWRAHRSLLMGGEVPQAQGDVFPGKLAQDVSAGPLTSPDNVVDIRFGPAWDDDEDTGRPIDADYSWIDGKEGDWVQVRRLRGKWYVEKFGGGGGEQIVFRVYDMLDDVTIGGIDYRAARCDVIAKSCSSEIHGADEDGRVLILDVLGCLFDEPDEDLEPTEDHDGRKGVASYQELIDEPTTGCFYLVTSLCCPPGLI